MRGFFKGMAFPLGAVGLLNSIFFGVYGNAIWLCYPEEEGVRSYTDIFMAGGFTGTVQAIPACPIDLVKVRLQAQTGTVLFTWQTATMSGSVADPGDG